MSKNPQNLKSNKKNMSLRKRRKKYKSQSQKKFLLDTDQEKYKMPSSTFWRKWKKRIQKKILGKSQK